MTVRHDGNVYRLTGNAQDVSLYNEPQAMVFINGSDNTIGDYFSTNVTMALRGNNESIFQYGGDPVMTISGFNATDSLSIYGLFMDGDGTPMARGSSPTAASLKSDGHGGWNLPLAFGIGNIDFAHTSEATILAAHIIGSVR